MNKFDNIYEKGIWQEAGGPRSGPGSTIANSRPVLEVLEGASPSSICDIGCGDLNFMRDYLENMRGQIAYTGIDVSPVALKLARATWIPNTVFLTGDVTAPGFEAHADCIVIKDILFHLQNWQIIRALGALERSTYRFLITNTDHGVPDERTLDDYSWARADLEGELFGPYLKKLGTIVAREARPAHGEYLFIRSHSMPHD